MVSMSVFTTVCVCDLRSHFLIARQKISYQSALRNGKEGGRMEAATHNQNLQLKLPPIDTCVRACVRARVCARVCACV